MNKIKTKYTRSFFKTLLKISGGLLKSSTFSVVTYPIADYLVKKTMGNQEVCDIQGFKINRGKTTRLLFLTGEIEPTTISLLKKEVKPGMVTLDLGANIGWFTLWFSKLVGDTGHVYSFEPNPDVFSVLKKNVELNKLTNCSIYQKAVSNQTGKGKLSLNPSQEAGNRLNSNTRKEKTIEVYTVSIDDFCSQHQIKVDFIKMDVEGSEPKVLEGMKNLILSNPKIKIVTEFSPRAIIDVGSSPKFFLESLENFGFTIKEIDEGNLNLKPINKEKLLGKRKIRPNLFCFRQ